MPRGSRLDGRPAGTVNLIGEKGFCLDFVNSVGARRFSPSRKMSLREEKLNDYLDLLAWGRHAGALTNADAEARAQEGNSHPSKQWQYSIVRFVCAKRYITSAPQSSRTNNLTKRTFSF